MSKIPIVLFEHQELNLNKGLTLEQLKALQEHYGSKGVPYYSLIHNGIKFREFVGVIQVGNLTIEVLPKADRQTDDASSKAHWQKTLISMLKAVGVFDVHAPSSSMLSLKSNSILELYFELFITEVQYLLRSGLIRQYRKIEGNRHALKGRLVFAKHIQQNIVHQERFYTRHTAYDPQHIWHIIIYRAISLIKSITVNADLQSRIATLELCFPPMPDKVISAKSFENLRYTRKTERYRPAIEIARLLILNYHPDLHKGRNNVLALMFNMNDLWELFVYVSLRKYFALIGGFSVHKQRKQLFWKDRDCLLATELRADIVIKDSVNSNIWVLDTKWKLPTDFKPSAGDLHQMLAYAELFGSQHVALIYPGSDDKTIIGNYKVAKSKKTCSVVAIKHNDNILQWQSGIFQVINDWRLSN